MNNLLKLLLFFLFFQCKTFENKFVVIIPSYNNSLSYKQNLDSIFCQIYPNYRIIYIDDCSSDNTGNLVNQYIKEKKQSHRFTLIKNTKRQFALSNIYKSVLMCEDDEIVVIVDGDDQLSNNNVLNFLNIIYQNKKVWITSGNFVYMSSYQRPEYTSIFPRHIIKDNKFREHPHGLIHLRTFYSWLFKQIKIEDLFVDDSFFKMTYDAAIFLPLIEMAADHYRFIHEILYIYNDNNPINDHKVSVSYQHYLNRVIRQKNKYQKLSTSKINFFHEIESKADIIIFLYDSNNLEKIIDSLKYKLKSYDKVYIINDSENILDSVGYEHIKIINKQFLSKSLMVQILQNIFDNDSQYVMFLDENFVLKNKIDINREIKNLEITKAFSINFGIYDSRLEQNSEIISKVFAYKYNKVHYYNLTFGAMYRKKDISSNLLEEFSFKWKYLGWNKICLFKYLKDNQDA